MNRTPNRRDFLRTTASTTLAALAMQSGRALAQDDSGGFKTKLKKGVVMSMLSGLGPVDKQFQIAKDCGFDGVEAHTTDNPKQVEDIRAAAEKAGLEIHSVMNSAHWEFPLSSDDPAVVKKSLEGMETSLRNAKAWGATTVLLVPAVVNEKTRYVEAYGRSQDQVKKLLPLAEELGVTIAVENVWNKFLLSPLEFAQYVDSFANPKLQAYFDVGNIVLYGYPQDWIRTLGPRINRVHIKGFKLTDGGYKWTNLREDSINWPEVRRALDEVGYNGYISAELSGGDEKYFRDLSERMDLIIAGK